MLRTGLNAEGISQSGNCQKGQQNYLTPFPRDATTASSQHYQQEDDCYFDDVADTTNRNVLMCRTLTELENCPGTSGDSALTQTWISEMQSEVIEGVEMKSDVIERVEYSTKLCLSTVTDVPTEHPEKNIEQSTHCQTLEFTHNTKMQKWTMKETTVDYMCELKITKQHPPQHGTDVDGDAAVSMKQEYDFHCPTLGGDTQITMTSATAINAALGANVTFNCAGTNAQSEACKITVETRQVKKGESHNSELLHDAFGGNPIDFSLRISTNNGATDTTIDYLSTTSQTLLEENVNVKESKLAVQIFGDTSTGGVSDVDLLIEQGLANLKPPNKQLASGNELMMQMIMSDLAPKTATIVWNAAVFVVTDHPLYTILKNANEDAWKAFMALTTSHKNTPMFGLSEAIFKSITTDYWNTNCKPSNFASCPCTTAADLNKNSQCYKNFINGVHYVDLVKNGVLQTHDESKMKVQKNSASCLASKPLQGCDADTSGNVIAPKDTADCPQGHVAESSLHHQATLDGDNLASTDAVMRRACKIAKGAALGTQSAFTASSQCQADTKTIVEFSVGADALASYIKYVETLNPAVKNDRMVHIRVEIKNVNYYTHGCKDLLGSGSRRLLSDSQDTTGAVAVVTSQATKVDNALVQLQTDLANVNTQIAVQKESYNSGLAAVAYQSATSTVTTLKAKIDDLKASASADAHMINTLTAQKNAAEDAKKAAEDKKIEYETKSDHWVIVGGIGIGLVVVLACALAYQYMQHAKSKKDVDKSTVQTGTTTSAYRPLFRQAVDL